MPDTLIAVIIAGRRRGRRGKNPNSGNNGPTLRRGSPLIKSTYDTLGHSVKPDESVDARCDLFKGFAFLRKPDAVSTK